jgi:hypothetical protein
LCGRNRVAQSISASFGISASLATVSGAAHAEMLVTSHRRSFWGRYVALGATF